MVNAIIQVHAHFAVTGALQVIAVLAAAAQCRALTHTTGKKTVVIDVIAWASQKPQRNVLWGCQADNKSFTLLQASCELMVRCLANAGCSTWTGAQTLTPMGFL